jgi:hypothetical protein
MVQSQTQANKDLILKIPNKNKGLVEWLSGRASA